MTSAAADRPPEQEHGTIVLRPRAVRWAAYFTGTVVLAGMILFAVLLTSFPAGGRLTLVAIGLLIFLFCHLEASVRAVARPRELEVRNLMRTRTVEWAEVLGISFPMGDPWAHLDLADGTTLSLHAVQRYDGKRAIAAAHLLQRLMHERGEAEPGI